MKLTKAQSNQLNDMVTQTRITRGKNAGVRKDALVDINHFDMRSFNKLISEKLVAPSEYNGNEWYAAEKGYAFWLQTKSAK